MIRSTLTRFFSSIQLDSLVASGSSIFDTTTSYSELVLPVFWYSLSRLTLSILDKSSAISVRVASSVMYLGDMITVYTP